MSMFKKNIITLVLLLFVYSWFFISNQIQQSPSLKVLGADTDIVLFVQPASGRQPILDAINSAQSEILVEVYLLSDKQIINALELAKQRGVIVDVMLEQHPFGGGNLNNISKAELVAKGVSFEWTNSSFSLTHEKSIVVDKSIAFILNQNLTTSSFTKNREYDVIDTNPEDVAEIRSIFIDDWERKTFSPKSTHLIVSPSNSRAAIETLIKSATKSLDIEMEIINDEQTVSQLCEKVGKIEVKIIAPTISQVGSNKDSLSKLLGCGVFIRTVSSPYIHAKLILVDNVKAYVGSINFSSQSMDENRELGIMLSESESIKNLAITFASDWNKGLEINQD